MVAIVISEFWDFTTTLNRNGFLAFKDAFPLFKETTMDDWVFSGPRAVKDFLQSIYEIGSDLGGYHLQWVKNSNVNQHTSVCHERRNLMVWKFFWKTH